MMHIHGDIDKKFILMGVPNSNTKLTAKNNNKTLPIPDEFFPIGF